MLTDSLASLSQRLQRREFSSVELTQYYLHRMQTLDHHINSFITICESTALLQAAEADARRAKGEHTPLLGIPIAHKDIFCTKGVKTSCGSKMLDNFIAPYSATLVSHLEAQGAVMLGKTNMDEFAMGSSNETSYYGPVNNPWHVDHVAGGSSGGSAAAVAARLTPAATGSDTGGSIRQPAALCGISGIKPTYGRISRYGMIAFASSLDQAGPMAASAEDCAILLDAMMGYDEKDSTSLRDPVSPTFSTLSNSIQGLKIGLPNQFFQEGLHDDIKEALLALVSQLEKQGAIIKHVDLPSMSLSIPAYYIIAPAECSSNLARYDGIRYGYRCENPVDLQDCYKRSRSEAFGKEVKRRLMIGTYVLSSGFYDAYYVKAQKIRQLIANDFKNAFSQVDILLGPTTPTTAFRIGEKKDDPVSMYLSDIYTIATNLAGLPAMSIPAGFSQGLPIGAQLIGPHLSEDLLLRVAHHYQQETDWHTYIPRGFTE
jgi:aspartyl-tRNA(Asn)/glutamyl-tRNA(Gln) amidotransferase subunit A